MRRFIDIIQCYVFISREGEDYGSKSRIFLHTTLRDGEQTPGVPLQTPEKIEIAKGLVRLGIDIIEAGFPAASLGFEALQTIARE